MIACTLYLFAVEAFVGVKSQKLLFGFISSDLYLWKLVPGCVGAYFLRMLGAFHNIANTAMRKNTIQNK